jgi:hypothetical protein
MPLSLKGVPLWLIRDRINRRGSPPQKGDASFFEKGTAFSLVGAPTKDNDGQGSRSGF